MHIFGQYLHGEIWQLDLIIFTAIIGNQVSINCFNQKYLIHIKCYNVIAFIIVPSVFDDNCGFGNHRFDCDNIC